MRDIFKNISETFSGRYGKKYFDHPKIYGGDEIKTALTTKNEKTQKKKKKKKKKKTQQ